MWTNIGEQKPELPSLKEAARLLGGEISGPDQVLCPGPGHSPNDRSLSIRFSPDAPDGFVVHSFAEARTPTSVWRARDYVREKLGLASWRPGQGHGSKSNGRAKRQIVAVYDYSDEHGTLRYQVVRFAPKDFLQRQPDGAGGWIWNLKGIAPLPYRLPELIEAIACDRPIFVVEGEKDVENGRKRGIVATCNSGGVGKWTPTHSAYLKGADVVIIPHNDGPGRDHGQAIAASLACIASRVRVLELPDLPPKGDLSNWLDGGGTAERLWALVEQAPEWRPETTSERRPKEEPTEVLPHWHVESWREPVAGADLLDDLCAILRRYMVLPQYGAEAVALWMIHAWTIDSSYISPFLVIVSPTKQCGKTTLLTILYWLTPRSVLASNVSAASIFRYIEQEHPTLLIDEADSFAKDNEELRGILNSGHTRPAARVIRCEGDGKNIRTRAFSTWAPKVVATIRALADTLMDRSIILTMRRKGKGEKVERLGLRDNDEFSQLRQRALRWAADNSKVLESADPNVPAELDNRPADNWRPLLAIADLAGSEWPKRAREAARALSGAPDDDDKGVMLLRDIRRVFDEAAKFEWLGAEALVQKLVALEETPWAEWRRGEKPITSRGVATMLKAFGIKSEKVRGPHKYYRKDFEMAWQSYLSP